MFRIWSILVAVLVLHAVAYSSPAMSAQESARGRVIERVVCSSDPDISYALYLPSNYDAKKKWPVLFAMDPLARGVAPVERFKEAAEAYGYIIAGSNNSRNGPWVPAAKAIMAMWSDVFARLAIDDRRVYAAGFSGGARFACEVAYRLKGQVGAVIGFGAGFPTDNPASASMPFVYFGAAGTDDFNYVEMRRLSRTLDELGISHRIDFFEGDHAWPPAEICTRAIEWIEVLAMKSGRRERDQVLIDALLKKAIDLAKEHENSARIYDAYAGYASLARDFSTLRNVAEFELKAAAIKNSREFKQALKKDREIENEQRTRLRELYRLRARLLGRSQPNSGGDLGGPVTVEGFATQPEESSDDRATALADLKRAVASLRNRSEAKENTPDRALARRVLVQFTVYAFETSMALFDRRDYDRAVANLTLDSELMPNDWRILFNLACAYSVKGDKKKSLDALKKSVEKGFSNVVELEKSDYLKAIKEEPAYKEIVAELKARK